MNNELIKEFIFSDTIYTQQNEEEYNVLHNPSVLIDVPQFYKLDSFHKLITHMKTVLRESDKKCGVCAIQFGIPICLCVIPFNGDFITIINPQLQKLKNYSLFIEESLSCPGKRYVTVRASEVDLYYTTPLNAVKGVRVKGLTAAYIQQLCDALLGIQISDEDSPFIEYTESIQYLTKEQEQELQNKIMENLNNKLKSKKK